MRKTVTTLLIGFCTVTIAFATEAGQGIEPAMQDGRSASFTVSEATHSYVDVCPTGDIIFDLLGDIYRVSAAGGTAVPILRGSSFQGLPRCSPDGRSIAYISDLSGQLALWTSAIDGSAAKEIAPLGLVQASPPVWEENGGLLVSSKRGDKYVTQVVSPQGGVRTLPVNVLPAQVDRVAANGTAYASGTPSVSQGPRSDVSIGEIALIDMTNARVQPTGILGFQPRWSSQLGQLLFARRNSTNFSLIAHNLRTGQERTLLEGLSALTVVGHEDEVPSFGLTTDGKTAFAWQNNGLKRVTVATGEVSTINVATNVDAYLASEPFPLSSEYEPKKNSRVIRWPTVLGASGDLVTSVLGKLYVTKGGFGTTSRVTDSSNFELSPASSPDGTKIAYVSWSDEKKGDVWIYDLKTRRKKKLTQSSGRYLEPAWSKDGKEIAYLDIGDDAGVVNHAPGAVAVRLVSVGEYTDRLIANVQLDPISNGRQYPSLGFASDGTIRVAGARTQNDGEDVGIESMLSRSIVNISTTSKQVTARILLPHADEVASSADGNHVAIIRRNKIIVIDLGRTGCDPHLVSNLEDQELLQTCGTEVLGTSSPAQLTWTTDREVIWAEASSVYKYNVLNGKKRKIAEVHVPLKRAYQDRTLAITNARVVTMDRDQVLDRGTILIEHGRIRDVGASDLISIPPGFNVFDASGLTIIPGLMDVHSHVVPPSELWRQRFYKFDAMLAYGITTIFDPASVTTLDPVGLAELIEIGEMVGPRYLSSGTVLFGDLGWERRSISIPIESKTDALDALRRRIVMLNGPLKEYGYQSRQQRKWIADAARDLRIPITAEGRDRITNLSLIVDGYSLEHPFNVTPIGEDIASLFAAAGSNYTPILVVERNGLPEYFTKRMSISERDKLKRFTPEKVVRTVMSGSEEGSTNSDMDKLYVQKARDVAKVLNAGGLVSAGTHGPYGVGIHWEMESLVLGGALPQNALRSATLNAARKLHIDGSLGSIEPGKIADLLILEHNPLEDIRATQSIRFVMKDGQVFDAATMTQVWPMFRSPPASEWEHGTAREAPRHFEPKPRLTLVH